MIVSIVQNHGAADLLARAALGPVPQEGPVAGTVFVVAGVVALVAVEVEVLLVEDKKLWVSFFLFE